MKKEVPVRCNKMSIIVPSRVRDLLAALPLAQGCRVAKRAAYAGSWVWAWV